MKEIVDSSKAKRTLYDSAAFVAGGFIYNELLSRLPLEVVDHGGCDQMLQILHGGGSLVLTSNHPGVSDPGLVVKWVNQHINSNEIGLNPNEVKLAYIASSKFTDGRMPLVGMSIQYIKSKDLLYETWPVVQSTDEEGQRIYGKKAGRMSLGALVNARKFMKTPMSILAYMPEGTRSSLGGPMQLDEKTQESILTGYRLFDKVSRDSTYPYIAQLPIAIEGSENVMKKGQKIPNLREKTTFHIGRPRTIVDIEEMAISCDIPLEMAFMMPIATMLPEKYWGEFAPYVELVADEFY